jgi:acyl-CoA synthetase (AMP-forming)/AMP-acid ligase II
VVAEPPTVPVPTGDYGVVDSDGWLTVLDRIKVLIVRGGANVYPAEVERVLMAQEGVRGVAVFGVPDDRLGERVAALVELNVDVEIDALAAACRTQLADYKVPERWGVVDSLPRNAMGKVVRTGLVDLLESSGGSTS